MLKLLRETYYKRVKMIYIDPPYNTGKDFIYRDNYRLTSEEYAERSQVRDEDGNLLMVGYEANNEANGRFHTDWLNMIYPRLKVARDLLTDDGVIFISIDDNEVHNLRKVCDEIFGEQNFVGTITRKQSSGSKNDSGVDKIVATADYLVVYRRLKLEFNPILIENQKRFNLSDDKGKFSIRALEMQGGGDTLPQRPKMGYSIYYNKEKNDVKLLFDYNLEHKKVYNEPNEILLERGYKCYRPRRRGVGDMALGIWRWGDETFMKRYNDGKVYFDESRVYIKEYEKDVIEKFPEAIIDTFLNSSGTNELKQLFNGRLFSFPKPTSLVRYLLQIGSEEDSIILDFFSGSATTAHAVMQLNVEDGGNRQFIMVQLPEEVKETSEAYKAGYRNICEIGKERIRRAGAAIKKGATSLTTNLDTGFRVFRLDSSNRHESLKMAGETTQDDLFAYRVKSDRTADDLLAETLLRYGFPLSVAVAEVPRNSYTYYRVEHEGRKLVACFGDELPQTDFTDLAEERADHFVCNEHSLLTDALKDNIQQIFTAVAPNTMLHII